MLVLVLALVLKLRLAVVWEPRSRVAAAAGWRGAEAAVWPRHSRLRTPSGTRCSASAPAWSCCGHVVEVAAACPALAVAAAATPGRVHRSCRCSQPLATLSCCLMHLAAALVAQVAILCLLLSLLLLVGTRLPRVVAAAAAWT